MKGWTLSALLFSLACARPFDIHTAPGFIELKQDASSSYGFVATTPDRVVLSVRVVDLEGEASEDLAFWTQAMTLELRDVSGYALESTTDVRSLDGTPGKQLRFGHDEHGKPYVFWLTFWIANKRIIVVEAGGVKPTFEKYAPSVEWMLKSVRAR